MSKPSLSGFFAMSNDVARFDGYLKTQVGNLYYAPLLGVDIESWLFSPQKFMNESFSTWISQEMLKKGIVTAEVSTKTEDFELKINYVLSSEPESAGIATINTNKG